MVDAAYPHWARRRNAVALPAAGPLISVLMPVHDTPVPVLAAAIGSVCAQTYADWQLCVADDASGDQPLRDWLAAAAAAEPRIGVVRLDANGGIAAATNAALRCARGDFVALLDHDDTLAAHALARVAAEIAAHPDAELIFSDEDKIVAGRRCCPYFKPGWNPDLMRAQNVVSHLGAYRRTRVLALGGLRAGFEGSQDYDLALRVASACGAARIRHVPEVLYHWRQSPASFSTRQAARASEAARRAVQASLPPGAVVCADPALPHWSRVTYPLPNPAPLVSAVVAGGGVAPGDTLYAAAKHHRGAPADAPGDVVLLLAPGLVAVEDGWLRELVSQALRPEVGAAGARLDGPDGRIAQSGLVLDPVYVAQTLRPRADEDDPGYVGQFRLPRTVSALSRDCLAVRRSVFRALGGMDGACGPYADVDFCLRLAAHGLRCVWTPHARLRYTTPPRVMRNPEAAGLMRARWAAALARDPYFNPNLQVRRGALGLRRPGREG